MALALYRKYRPRVFAEVIGQEHVTEPLMQALRTGRLNHAYLFSGPRGCGKTSSARILARSLNCEKGPTPQPCGECDSCLALAPDGPGSIDVIEIDAASHGGVDDARDLRERAFFAPVSSRFKVYIIDEAHMVSTQGFNALLKLVEEPPDYVKFVFATTEPEKVLGTIRSRTHHYPFRLIPPNVLRPFLEKLCQQEGVNVDAAVFPLVVRAGGGSARDSLSVLDQLIAGASVDGVTYARAVALLGVTDVALIDEMTDALAAGDGGTAFATIDRVADAGHDARRFTSDLLERFRDLIVLQKVPDAAGSGIIEVPSDQMERMTAQASRMGPATLSRLADIAHNGLTEMRGTTAPRLLLELVVARMLLPGADESHGALLQRLERMERRLGAASEPWTAGAESEPGGAASVPAAPVRAQPAPGRVRPTPVAPSQPSPPVARPAPASQTAPVPPSVAAVVPAAQVGSPGQAGSQGQAGSPGHAGSQGHAEAHDRAGTSDEGGSTSENEGSVDPAASIDAAALRRVWDEVLSVVRRRSPRAWAVVREAMVRDVHADEIVLVFQHGVHANMFGAQAGLLVDAVREVLGGTWRVRAELGTDGGAHAGAARAVEPVRPAPATPPAPAPASRQASAKAPARNAPRTAPAPVPPVGDDGWPTPAALGGGSASANDSSAPAGSAPSGSGPSGGAPAGAAGSAPARSGPAGSAPAISTPFGSAATGQVHVGVAPGGSGGPGATRSGSSTVGPAPARAPGGRNAGRARGGDPSADRIGKAGRSAGFTDDLAPDEPPFDPDYDPVPPQTAYEGFDPGDEPLDDASTVRETSEEQAIRVLTEHFGAEKIDGTGPQR